MNISCPKVACFKSLSRRKEDRRCILLLDGKMDTPFSYKLEKTCTADYWRVWTVWAGVLTAETKRTGSESGPE